MQLDLKVQPPPTDWRVGSSGIAHSNYEMNYAKKNPVKQPISSLLALKMLEIVLRCFRGASSQPQVGAHYHKGHIFGF